MSHSIEGWTEKYQPIGSIPDPRGGPMLHYMVTCSCGAVFTGWNPAICGGEASQHVWMSIAAEELDEMRKTL